MATGVVSLCFGAMGLRWLSMPLFAVAAVTWIAVLAVLGARLLTEPGRCVAEAGSPAALTLVAGTAVLGSRLAAGGRADLAEGLLAAGVLLGLALLRPVLGRWPVPTVGTSFLSCVAPQALVVLAARLAPGAGGRWESYAAAVVFVAGLAVYGAVVSRFDAGQVVSGEGDQWVLGGALAISTLAGCVLLESWARLGAPDTVRTVLRVVTVCLGLVAAVLYVLLGIAEVVRPRLGFATRRWSTVFPLGMAGLASFHLSGVFHREALWRAGEALSWLALAVWVLVAAGTLRWARAVIAGSPGGPGAGRAS